MIRFARFSKVNRAGKKEEVKGHFTEEVLLTSPIKIMFDQLVILRSGEFLEIEIAEREIKDESGGLAIDVHSTIAVSDSVGEGENDG